MKIIELSTKEYEELYKKGLVEEEKWTIEDNDDLELLPEDELHIIRDYSTNWNFRVLKDKINELVKEINEIRKEMK